MAIVLVGLNHRSAPVELRERLALSGCALRMALGDLRELRAPRGDKADDELALDEVAILSTCNRLEVYAAAHDASSAIAAIEQFLSKLQNTPFEALSPHLYHRTAEEAVGHLIRVACGLDSMILGEPQILGQVTQAFEDAHAANVSGPILSRLFVQAIHAGKRARAETAISRYTTSVSHVGAQKVIEELAESNSRRILVVGAGEMAVLVADALKRSGMTETAFINRTYNRAQALADEAQGQAFAWHQLEAALEWADAVISATGAPHTVIYRHDLEGVSARRAGRTLVIVDIAVPRDVEDTVRELPGIRYYDIDDLQSVVDANLELRKAAIPQVEAIVQHEMLDFAEWYHSRQVAPVIKNLREWAQSVAEDELAHTLNRLPDADAHTRQVVARLAHRLVNRLLHEPITRLRVQAVEGNGHGYAHAIRELFALGDQDRSLCPQDEPQCNISGQSNGSPAHCNLQCILPSVTG